MDGSKANRVGLAPADLSCAALTTARGVGPERLPAGCSGCSSMRRDPQHGVRRASPEGSAQRRALRAHVRGDRAESLRPDRLALPPEVLEQGGVCLPLDRHVIGTDAMK